MYEVIKDRKIRMAIVGCGRISKNHFDSIKKHANDIELVAICDTNKDILKAHKEKYNVPAYIDINTMLEQENLDIVTFMYTFWHSSYQTEVVAAHGVHVITEKPMATRWKDGVEMVKTCDKAGVRLFVVKQNRHNSTFNSLSELYKKNALVKLEWFI